MKTNSVFATLFAVALASAAGTAFGEIEYLRTPASRVRVSPSATQTFSVSVTNEVGGELSYAWKLYNDAWDWIEDGDSTTNSWVFDASGRAKGRYYVEVSIAGGDQSTDVSWQAVVADPLAAPDTNGVVVLTNALTGAGYNRFLGFSGGVPRYDEDDNPYFTCTVIDGEIPDGLKILGFGRDNPSYIRIDGTPEDDAAGIYDFKIRVTGDFGESVEQAFRLTVVENPDHRPKIQSKTPSTYRVRVDPAVPQTFSVLATDADGDELSYDWTLYDDWWDPIDVYDSAPSNWVFDASGVGKGHYYVEVRVTGSNLWTTASWYVVVAETKPLAAPDASGVVVLPDAVTDADYEGNLGFTGGVPFYDEDEELEYFECEVVGGDQLPDGLSVPERGYYDAASSIAIGGTPKSGAAGTYEFTIRVTGDGNETVEQTYRLTVVQNAKPVIESASPAASYVTIRAGAPTTFGIEASDPDNDALDVTWKLCDDCGYLISDLTPETDGTVLFSIDDVGEYEIVAEVDDGFHEPVNRHWYVTVVAADAILLEAVAPAADWDGVVSVGETVVFSVAADDPEGRPLTFEWEWDGVRLEETGTSWTWTPGREDIGYYGVVVRCSDGERHSNWVDWSFQVVTTNDLVVDVSLPVALAGEPYSETFSVTGGTEPYSWSLPDSGDPLPAEFAPGMLIAVDGTVSGTPTTSGTYRVSVSVVDDEGASWSGTAVFHVVEAGDPVTKTTPVPVPYSWLDGHGLGGGTAEGREAAAKADAANGRPVWTCYVADLDPTDPAADLVADIEVVDGEPRVGVLEGKSANRVYTVQGAKKLGGGWNDLVAGDDWDAAGFRFFRIKVDLQAE